VVREIFQAGEMSEGMSRGGGMSYTLTWRPTIMVSEQWPFYGRTFKSGPFVSPNDVWPPHSTSLRTTILMKL